LVGGRSKCAAEHQLAATWKFEQPAGKGVNAEMRIAIEQSDDSCRLRAEDVTRRDQGVATHVIQGAAA
jgi:hypothetical protein